MASIEIPDEISLSRSSSLSSLPSVNSNNTLISNSDQHDIEVLKAEIVWCLLKAEYNITFRTSDHIFEALVIMFPDSLIASSFKCKRTKTSYVIADGLCNEFQERLIQSLKTNVFSLMIDESNKAYGRKYLFLLVKFYSQEQGNVVIGFLDAHIANEGKADDLVAAVVKTFEDYGIPFENLLQLMTDNPNVMRSLYTGVVTQLKQKYADHLLDIGGCSLHHLTNGAKKSIKELYRYEEIEDIV